MKIAKEEKQNHTIMKILQSIRPYWFYMICSIGTAAVTVILTLMVPILVGDAIDFIIDQGQVDFPYVMNRLIWISVIVLITALSQWLMNICNNKITYNTVRDIRNQAFAKIEILPLKYIDTHTYGEIVSRVIADVDQFADGLLMGFTQFFTGVLTIVGTLGFMLFNNVMITLVVVCITPVSFLVAGFIANPGQSEIMSPNKAGAMAVAGTVGAVALTGGLAGGAVASSALAKAGAMTAKQVGSNMLRKGVGNSFDGVSFRQNYHQANEAKKKMKGMLKS